MLSLIHKHTRAHIRRKSIRLNHIIAHWTQSINDSPKLNQVSEIESSQFICKNATHIDGFLFVTHSLRPQWVREREASIQYTKLIWNDYGVVFGSLVNQQHYYLPSTVGRNGTNGWTEDQSLTINSEIPIYKIHIPCMAWPFPYFPRFQWLTIYRPSILALALFIFVLLLDFVRVTLPFCGFEFLIMLFCAVVVVAVPSPSTTLRCRTSVRYHHSESIETLFGNSIVIYWLPIDLLQRNERRCEKWPTPKTRTRTKKAHTKWHSIHFVGLLECLCI